MGKKSDVPITFEFSEEKIKRFKEAEMAYNAMNYPIVVEGKYLCDLDWITYEMFATIFYKFPEEEILKFLKESGYLDKIKKGEMKQRALEFQINDHLMNMNSRSGKKPDIDYAIKLHAYRVSPEFQEWEKKLKEGPRWELL